MASHSELFSTVNFQGTMQKYASQNGWRIAEINDRRVIMRFDMQSGRTQTLYIIKYETTLEFSVPSVAIFPSQDSIPHIISTVLLKKNAKNRFGFWCIEEIGGKQVYSYMHNAEMQLLTAEYFGKVITSLITECDTFEETLKKMMHS